MHSCQRENSLNGMLDDDDLRVAMIMNLMMILKSCQREGETKPAVSANGNDNGHRCNEITKINLVGPCKSQLCILDQNTWDYHF